MLVCFFSDSVGYKRLEVTASTSNPHSTLTLSHQNFDSVIFTPRTSDILVVSRTPTIAPINSSLGMLVAMFGDTRVLPQLCWLKLSHLGTGILHRRQPHRRFQMRLQTYVTTWSQQSFLHSTDVLEPVCLLIHPVRRTD